MTENALPTYQLTEMGLFTILLPCLTSSTFLHLRFRSFILSRLITGSGIRRKVIHSTCYILIHIIIEYLLWQHLLHLICKFEKNNWMFFLRAVLLSPGVNLLEGT